MWYNVPMENLNTENNDLLNSGRSEFYKKTYLHVAGAIGVFALVEAFLIQQGFGEKMMQLLGTSEYSWLIVLGLFMGAGWIANKWAMSGGSREKQYAGLGIYIIADAIVFLPLIYMAVAFTDGSALSAAGITTAFLVLGISALAFVTKKDFSFLGKYLMIFGFVAMGTIVAGILFKFTLGVWFAGALAVFAGFSLLHSTSNLIHHYREEQYVAASLSLFADIALMFYYILQIFMSRD